jgi:HK97 family phage major capsid protein
MGRKIDEAIIFGTGKPSTWRDSILTTAVNAAATVTIGTNLYQDIMGETGVIAKAEQSGYLPTGIMAAVPMRSKLRGLVDTQKRPLFMSDMQGAARYALDGIPMEFPMNGAWDPDQALMILGDFSQLVYSIRQDVTYKILTEATIVDPSSQKVIYSLAQQDMVALRAVMRLGWEIPNPISGYRENLGTYSPFAVYLPA